ncbi:cation:proton antiporter [Chloroflexota bacterium]
MSENLLLGLAGIVVLGIAASWLAWRLRLPSIFVLLIIGLIAGPVTGFLNPDEIFGDLLLSVVSLSVAVILFEGGLGLSIAELKKGGRVVFRLITFGVAITWIIAAATAYFMLDLELELAVLLGAILVVTGPTVILPLLRHLRPSGDIGSILKWEGIVIDPIGAILAVIVFQVIIAAEGQPAASIIALSLTKAVIGGGIIGVAGAVILVQMLKRFWIPDYLHSIVSLALVITAYTAADYIQPDSGLIAVTLMGIAVANQKSVNVKHIIEFKENLRVMLISSLFIMLTARLQMDDLSTISVGSIALLAVLILIARPAVVALATIGSKLKLKQRLFISWMAPRGIVAAAVASVFSIRLQEAGYAQAELLMPLTFVVIAGTVTIYGLTAPAVASRLKVAEPNPQGVLMVGGQTWARTIAAALHKEGFRVLVVDTSRMNITAARMLGVATYYGNILSQHTLDRINLSGIGRLIALTSDNEYNSLATLQLSNDLGRSTVYQLPAGGEEAEAKKAVSQHLRGRLLFSPDATYGYLAGLFAGGASVKTTEITEDFGYDAYKQYYGDAAMPLFLIDQSNKMTVITADNPPRPKAGQKLISIIRVDKKHGGTMP